MRHEDWQSRLHEYLAEHDNSRFEYGSIDCGLFVADVALVLTGVDPAADLRGKYTNRKEAFTAIKTLCGKATMEAVADYLANKCGFVEVPVLFAQRGDAVLIGSGINSRLGIVAMHGTELLAPGKTGLYRLPLEQATKAWRIE